MRISDWSSTCALPISGHECGGTGMTADRREVLAPLVEDRRIGGADVVGRPPPEQLVHGGQLLDLRRLPVAEAGVDELLDGGGRVVVQIGRPSCRERGWQ